VSEWTERGIVFLERGGFENICYVAVLVLYLMALWYLLPKPDGGLSSRYFAEQQQEQQDQQQQPIKYTSEPEVETTVEVVDSDLQLPPEIQEHYIFAMSSVAKADEIECVYNAASRYLNCPEVPLIVNKSPINWDWDSEEVETRATLIHLADIYRNKANMKRHFSTEESLLIDPAVLLEEEIEDTTITVGDKVYLVASALPVRNPFVDPKDKSRIQHKLTCKKTRWLTLKAKRAAGC
jgi:hypothetical protein